MPVYAIVDCAADDALYNIVLREPRSQSLLDGKISRDLIDATPHIVLLAEGSLLSAELWAGNRPLGIFFNSEQTFDEARRQLRRNLQVILPDGQLAMFRFFDPRVFPIYIESSPEEGLLVWFGAITDWWVPGEADVGHYFHQDGSLVKRLLPNAKKPEIGR